MKEKLYTLFDNKVKAHHIPIMYHDHNHAIADITLFVNSKENSEINPIDYDLFYVGEFDNETGKLCPAELPEHITNLASLKSTPEKKKMSHADYVRENIKPKTEKATK